MSRRLRRPALVLFLTLAAASGLAWWVRALARTPDNPVGPGPFHARPSAPRCVGTPALTLFALGDTGQAGAGRDEVVSAMHSAALVSPPHAVVLLGDNFYPRGVDSPRSPRFDRDFEAAFPAAWFPVPFYVALGNHDHKGSIAAQVDYESPTSRWDLPAPYYVRRIIGPGDVALDLFVLDTVPLLARASAARDQLEWLRAALLASDADWQVVAGHHPLCSGGAHGDLPALRGALAPTLRVGGADLYLAGHDHDLQVLELEDGLLCVVAGSGSLRRTAGKAPATLYAESAFGFARLSADHERLCVRLMTREGVRDERHVAPRAPIGG